MSLRESSLKEETEWLTQIARGDEVAFVQFYRRFSGPIFSMLVKMLNNPQDAEEVLSLSFLEIWKAASTFDAKRSAPFTWLVMIVRHRALDRIRLRARHERMTSAAALEINAPPYAAPPPELALDRRAVLEGALAKIPEDQRHAIELAFFRGLTHDEISENLGTPLGTVKARIRRGILRLRDLLHPAS